MISSSDAALVLADIDAALSAVSDQETAARLAVERLSRLPHFNWVGVYWLVGDELVLGPYVGAPTDHTRIPVGRGVCGTAVAENANQIVSDVRELGNYLACSLETRSEIVVLIRDAGGGIIGQIDVDGHQVGAFDGSDESVLSEVASRISSFH